MAKFKLRKRPVLRPSSLKKAVQGVTGKYASFNVSSGKASHSELRKSYAAGRKRAAKKIKSLRSTPVGRASLRKKVQLGYKKAEVGYKKPGKKQ